MVKTRSKPANEPAQQSNRKRQISNADEVQSKRARTEDDEASKSEQSNGRNKERGRKKRGSNRGKSISTLRDIINFFFSKTATQRAAQDIAADAAGPPIHLTK